MNVRLITATNRDLEKAVAAGTFREDLYFRLNVIRLVIPSLRERVEDIPLLIDHFLSVFSTLHRVSEPTLTPEALDMLIAHRWPGNIRQLKNVIERLVLKNAGRVVGPEDLPADAGGITARHDKTVTPRRSHETEPASQMSQSEELIATLLHQRESFWSAVYPLFMARDLTRKELRAIIQDGLERTNGNYRLLVELFNMRPGDYQRFLAFLRKHDCLLPFQRFRTAAITRLRTPVVSATAR